jgi:hypothetical protein
MSTEITVVNDIVEINVQEDVIVIEAPSGAYPLPTGVYSVYGRTGNVVAQDGDYNLTQLGDVTITSPATGQVLRYNGTTWVNSTESYVGTVTSVAMTTPTGLTITGSPITTSGTLAVGLASGYSIPTDANQSLWTSAYNDKINSAAVTGTTTKTLTLNQQDGGTITASWTDDNTDAVTSVFGRTGDVVAQSGDYNTLQVTENTNLYFTDQRARFAISGDATSGVVYSNTTGIIALDDIPNTSLLNPSLTVNGKTVALGGSTTLTTTDIGEGTNLYFTTARAQAAISGTAPISVASGVVSISQANSTTNGYLSSADWTTFNSKQNALTLGNLTSSDITVTGGTGAVVGSGSTLTLATVNSNVGQFGSSTAIPKITVNGKGLITAISTEAVFIPSGALSFIGDVTGTGNTGSDTTLTLATVNSNVGAYGSSTSVPTITVNAKGLVTAASQTAIPTATSSVTGLLTSSDWSTFNAKQAQLNGTGFVKVSGTTVSYDNSTYLTTIEGIAAGGELSGTYASPSLVNSAVTGKVLTGLNVTGGSVTATDSILAAFGKVQNQINGLIGGSIYQGTWNASTNTPALASGVGTKGYYYIVSVAGSTNLDGITDWNVGDWAIYDGTAWQQVDNTDAVVSVNGFTGAVSLTTSNISEGTNLYYTDARARGSVSAGTGISYNSTTGVITNSAPDQTVSLTGAGTTSISGTYPNFTITSNDQYVGTVTSVGLTSTAAALSISNSPITTSGNIGVNFAGTSGQYVAGDGSLVSFPSLSGYVPYTGATANLDLGTFDLTTDIATLNQVKAVGSGGLSFNSNSGTQVALMGGGGGAGTTFYGGIIGTSASFASSGGSDTFAINHSSGSGIALNITKGGNGEGLYINKTSGSGNAATIIGTLNATTLVKNGGTSSEFLKADGSVDSTSYQPLITAGTTSQYYRGDKTFQTLDTSVVPENTNLYYTDARARGAISLTTTGNNGASTYNSTTGVLNVPTYTLAGLGGINLTSLSATSPLLYDNTTGVFSIQQSSGSQAGYLSSADWTTFNNKVPSSRTLSINGTTYDLSADRSWTITPNVNATNTQDYTATAAQTTFTVTGGYTVGQLAVYYNGSKLAAAEYTALDGSTFTLATGCQANDIVQAVVAVTGGGIGGSGTTNYISKWTASGVLGNSTIQDNGTTITLGSALSGTTGTFSGQVEGTIINSTSNAFRLNGNNALSLVTLNSQSVVKINAAGFWGTQLVGANDKGILINNTGEVQITSRNLSVTNNVSNEIGVWVKGVGTHTTGYASIQSFASDVTYDTRLVLQENGGKVLIGTTSTLPGSTNFNVLNNDAGPTFANNTSGQQSLLLWNKGTSGNNLFTEFHTESSITIRGSIDYNRASNVTRYNTTSDGNLKNIIGDSDKQKSIDILNSTRIREYSWKEDETNKTQIGVIAQELYQTYKGAVSKGSDDELFGTEDYKTWGVDKTAFTFHLIAGWQMHEQMIKELRAEVDTLKQLVK